ncbi:hypothetical protein A0J61_11595, partial [Choanephora cucurbitarum]
GDSESTIDYIYASPVLFHHLHSSTVDFINSFTFASHHQGPGLWRAHPNLAHNRYFTEKLTSKLDEFHYLLRSSTPPLSPQEQWDDIKVLAKMIAQQVVRPYQRQLTRLHRKRNKLLREHKLTSILPLRLAAIEKQIGIIQQGRVETLALRAGKHWRDNGETSTGYLKSTISSR